MRDTKDKPAINSVRREYVTCTLQSRSSHVPIEAICFATPAEVQCVTKQTHKLIGVHCAGLTFKDRSSDYVQICNSRSHIIQYGFVCGSVIPVKQRSINCQLAVNWQWKNGIVAVVTSTAGCQKRFWYAMGKQRSTLLRPS